MKNDDDSDDSDVVVDRRSKKKAKNDDDDDELEPTRKARKPTKNRTRNVKIGMKVVPDQILGLRFVEEDKVL